MLMIYVYVIRSLSNPTKLYVGQTQDVECRLAEHNARKSRYTQTFIPWEVIYTESFDDRMQARVREVYLKSTAGKTFLRKSGII